MTTPPAPPAPAPPAPPAPAPPAPAPPAPAPPAPAPPEPDTSRLEATLADERRLRKEAEAALVKLQQQGMTDAEKAIADARAEGKAEAAAEHARELAAAEFRAQAAGRIKDPDAALAVLALDKLLKDGKPDKTAIGRLVEQLAAVPPQPGHVPPGAREQAPNGTRDWLREIQRPRR